MSLDDVAKILQAVAHTLKTDPRNEYEASLRYTSNVERLSKVRKGLEGFSGAYPDALRGELAALASQVESSKSAAAKQTVGAFTAFEFSGEDENEEEVAAAEKQLREEELKRKPKKGPKKGNKKESRKHQEDKNSNGTELCEAPDSGADGVPTHATSSCTKDDDDNDEVLPVWQPAVTMKELARYNACSYVNILAAALGRAECRLIQNTPNAALIFQSVVDFDGSACQCAVEVPRFLVQVLAKSGLRLSSSVSVSVSIIGDHDDAADDQSDPDEDLAGEGDTEEYGQLVVQMGDRSNVVELSEQLVDEFDDAKEEEEVAERSRARFPRELPAIATAPIRQVTEAVWVILMCHGGYFAGGIFKDGACVVHKSFQRYVVRKKQGGRQSTNAKDGGGSYNSIGSQIRAAQEVKWRLDVRSLLYAWRPYIDGASFILYVAPGPQNRSVLSDFASLPPSTTQGEAGPSPVSFKDPRVHKAPLTTHRPSFEEVQRIFSTVSRCNIVYGNMTDPS